MVLTRTKAESLTYYNKVVRLHYSERDLLFRLLSKESEDEKAHGCRTGGAGYEPAVLWVLTGRVERVQNWATAKFLADKYHVGNGLIDE